MQKNISATSPGKVIISGEHSAVYDQPALASPINLFVKVELWPDSGKWRIEQQYIQFFENILRIFSEQFHKDTKNFTVTIDGDLPIGSGLGSSAAFAHATLKALAKYFTLEISPAEMIALIQESERYAHGHRSGLDATAVVLGGVVEFQRHGDELTYKSVPSKNLHGKTFFLIDSGRPVETTKDMISFVKTALKERPKLQKTIEDMGKLTTLLTAQIKDGLFESFLLTKNQRFLEDLGVVSERAAAMVREIEAFGGFAKVSGAGGRSEGSGILLAYHEDSAKLREFLHGKKWPTYPVILGNVL